MYIYCVRRWIMLRNQANLYLKLAEYFRCLPNATLAAACLQYSTDWRRANYGVLFVSLCISAYVPCTRCIQLNVSSTSKSEKMSPRRNSQGCIGNWRIWAVRGTRTENKFGSKTFSISLLILFLHLKKTDKFPTS